MKTRSLAHVGDEDLLRDGIAAATHERGRTADLLAYIAEIDARKLYLREACHSMKDYCIRRMRLEADAASKRIQAARIARRFPAILDLVEDGRLHLAGVVLLAPHLTEGNAGELLAAAADRSKRQIEELIAVRFPRSEILTLVPALRPAHSTAEPSCALPGNVAQETMDVMGRSRSHAPGHVDSTSLRPKVEPIASGRFALQVMIDRSTYEDLEYARALLGHQLPGGEIGEVLARALRALVGQLEKTRFAATRPRSGRPHTSANPRHIPRWVKCAVWERDGGQCTFTSEGGHRCTANTRLEWDHIEPVARGGQGTVENLRLVCRAHNQYLAERTFGEGFMSEKREAAQRAAEARQREMAARETETEWSATEARRQEPAAQAAETTCRSAEAQRPALPSELAEAARRAQEAWRQELAARAEEAARHKAEEARVRAAIEEIVTPLRLLGCRKEEARRIAATCASLADAPLKERLRFAIRQLAPPHRTVVAAR